MAFDWAGILNEIYVDFANGKTISLQGKDVTWSIIPQFPACQTINFNDQFDFGNKVPSLFLISFKKIPNIAVSMKIEDARKSLSRRTLYSNIFDYEGIPLEIDNLTSEFGYQDFSLNLYETINLESDTGKQCKNYPTKEFLNYSECDQAFVHEEMKNKYKIMPFWAAKTMDEITNYT